MKYPQLPKDCKSLLSKYLNEQVFDVLKDKVTNNGFTLQKAIDSGIQNLDSGIGIYAGDQESYPLFSPIFDPIIEEYHGFGPNDQHQSNLNTHELVAPNPDPTGKYIISTRIRVGRNLAEFPLGPAVTKTQRNTIEKTIIQVLNQLEGELSGDYYPLLGMSDDVQNRLIEDHFLFKKGDRFLEAAGLNRDWPEARGIYHNDDKTFLVWVNEEDQLRIISMQMGGDIHMVFTRLMKAIKFIGAQIPFAYNDRLGYISSCPTNLGTAMRASVHIALPHLAKDMESFKKITNQYHLQIRGIHGEHSESEGGIFDISNRRRLGVTEVEAVQGMYDGVVALMKANDELCSKVQGPKPN